MLSNTSSAIARRRQQHRRQNSTPVAFEAPNLQPLPATIEHQRRLGNAHRRGMSLDQRPTYQQPMEYIDTPPQRPTSISQDDFTVSIGSTNQGQIPQHSMQVAQQHSVQPGPPSAAGLSQAQAAFQTQNQHFQSHLQHPHHQQYQIIQPHPSNHQPPQLDPLRTSIGSQNGLQQSHPQLQSPAVQLSPTHSYPPQQRQGLSPGPSQEQVESLKKQIEQVYGAFGATIQVNILPSPVAAPQKVDNTDIHPIGNLNDMNDIHLEPSVGGYQMTPHPSSDPSMYSPDRFTRSAAGSPRQHHVQSYLENVEEVPLQQPVPQLGYSDAAPLLSSPMMQERSHSSFLSSSPIHSPTRSPRAMSIADLNLDGSIEDTGITADEIQQYISQQDPGNHRWTCLFEGCNKTFGRRENIRSHVQTHLGDRQYRCNHCQKCFVRQHDLKRHAKIHSGDKPYRCPCGGGFARQDALTRHRQRGMCVGGFPGAVRSTARRGRPRKKRPDMEDRLEKANRTRRNVASHRYAGSISSLSDDSAMSPIDDFNCFDSAPLGELAEDPVSDPFDLDPVSSPLPSTPPSAHPSFNHASSPHSYHSPIKTSGSSHASPAEFDTTAGAQDPAATYDAEREKADVDALFDFSGVAERIGAQTPPHSPHIKAPGSGSTRSTRSPRDFPSGAKSPSHQSSNSAGSAAFTTPPTSPLTGNDETVDVTETYCDFTASTMSMSAFEGAMTATTTDMSVSMSMFMDGANEYASEEMMGGNMSWLDAAIDSHY